MGIMKNSIGPAALLEQLAEESAELAHAALKLARIMRGENPTPVEYHDAVRNLIEEYTDVIQCGEDLEIEPDRDQIFRKTLRFAERCKAANLEKIKRLLDVED